MEQERCAQKMISVQVKPASLVTHRKMDGADVGLNVWFVMGVGKIQLNVISVVAMDVYIIHDLMAY
jgi:hypothetical protein